MLERYAIKHNLLPDEFNWCTDYNFDPGLKMSTPYVPILMQPQLGIKEFKKLLGKWEEMSKYHTSIFNEGGR